MNDGGTVLEAVGSVLLCQTRLASIQFARDIESPHVSKSLDPAVGYLGLVNLSTQSYTGDLQFSGYVENTVVKTDVLLVFVAMGGSTPVERRNETLQNSKWCVGTMSMQRVSWRSCHARFGNLPWVQGKRS